jgi:hypothetical protein
MIKTILLLEGADKNETDKKSFHSVTPFLPYLHHYSLFILNIALTY